METNYDLELEKAVDAIKKQKAKSVLIQLPDGLKSLATKIVDELEEKTGADVMIYFSTCFGACDLPTDIDVDLIIQFGHSPWKFEDDKIMFVK